MMDPDPKPEDFRRTPRNAPFLIILIVAMATVVGLQYTSHPLFGPEKTATLWGMLVGLFIGGFLFGWLRRPWS